MKGRRDEFGNNSDNFSLKQLLKKLSDFVNEETLLQCNAEMIGATVDLTPKCHPEVTGEGIEHMWAHLKTCIAEKKC